MKYLQILPYLILFASCTPKENESTNVKTASDYFPKEKAQVLIVGTFHMDYPGLDAIKTNEEDKVDVLKEPKKSEVTELVKYIERFKPNKIAIEAFDTWNATEKLRKYKNGEFRNQRDERYQLGMRIANDLGLDTLYAIDSWAMDGDLAKLDSVYMSNLFKDYDFQSDDPYLQMFMDWIGEEEKNVSGMNLVDYFKLINSRESHQYGYGAYLVGDFKLDNERGADILSVWWYNRNVRIFRKLQTITEDKNDRILVIFGNGHAAVLRQLLECSPEYDFVEFSSL